MKAPRFSRPGDEPGLKALWRAAFREEDAFLEAFFRELYAPGMAALIEAGGEIVSAAYTLPFGEHRYIYAVATLPSWRGRGYGKAVTLAAAGGAPAYLCPADEKLRDWYVREMGAQTAATKPVLPPPEALGALRPLTPEEYAARREALLFGTPHAEYSPAVLRLFASFGGFYADASGGIFAIEEGGVREALPCVCTEEPHILALNGAPPLYWGLTLE